MRELLMKERDCLFVHVNRVMEAAVNSANGTWPISFELCPDRSLDFERLSSNLKPQFCSITWLARDQGKYFDSASIPALMFAKQIHSKGYNDVLMHLAGRNLNRIQAFRILNHIKIIGIRSILVLQGDPAITIEKDDSKCDFPYAKDLIMFIKEIYGNYFKIAVAGYPEMHPSSGSLNEDLTHLKNKVSAGADFIITQASFEYEAIEHFYINCRKFGIEVPIITGIYIITSYKGLMAMSTFCNVHLPKSLFEVVLANKENPESLNEFGFEMATKLIGKILTKNDYAGVHIFTLNNLNSVGAIFKRLDLIKTCVERPLLRPNYYRDDKSPFEDSNCFSLTSIGGFQQQLPADFRRCFVRWPPRALPSFSRREPTTTTRPVPQEKLK